MSRSATDLKINQIMQQGKIVRKPHVKRPETSMAQSSRRQHVIAQPSETFNNDPKSPFGDQKFSVT